MNRKEVLPEEHAGSIPNHSGSARRRLDDRALLTCSLLIAVAVPFLLPHMHDRYFFLADALRPARRPLRRARP